ncbi:MAG: hypothetical protein AB8B84_13160 [Granulosicoccus sp.]
MSAQAQPLDRQDVAKAAEVNDQTKTNSGASVTATVTPITAAVADKPAAPSSAALDENKSETTHNNLIKRTVDEIYGLMAEVHEIREELLAHGVQFHMLNAMIELGVHEKPDEQAKMVTTAVEASVKAHGPQAIERAELEQHLEEIVVLEKDLRHVRHVASQQGVHMQALNHLTQLMRLNPGDKGVQAINTFVAYADAAGIKLDRLDEIREQFKDGPASVLPDIPRGEVTTKHDELIKLGKNVVLGLLLTAIMMWWMVL